MHLRFPIVAYFVLLMVLPQLTQAQDRDSSLVRVATFNTAMNRRKAGMLADELESGKSQQAKRLAEIIQRVRPDVILLNEVDYDEGHRSADAFHDLYLKVGQEGQSPITYVHRFDGSVNTGVPFGADLDRDGKTDGAADAYGYGAFPGQYGMVVMSKYPLDVANIRTFQKFLWKDMPNAKVPTLSDGTSYYSKSVWNRFRLSSKSHWDVPIQVNGHILHLLASHPTPPVFDGPEDRNGTRNHDEIRFWADYVSPDKSDYVYDDKGQKQGLKSDAKFVIVGDLNADPNDGDSTGSPIKMLLSHELIDPVIPKSAGAVEKSARDGKANLNHQGPAESDTGDFSDNRTGNLRIDYVLPSKTLNTVNSGVFWPAAGQPGNNLVTASDHRLVWIDLNIAKAE